MEITQHYPCWSALVQHVKRLKQDREADHGYSTCLETALKSKDALPALTDDDFLVRDDTAAKSEVSLPHNVSWVRLTFIFSAMH